MQFRAEHFEHITVVTIKGRIDAICSADLQACLFALLHEGHIYLLINCEEVEFLSSAGMRAFLLTFQELEKIQGKMVFCKFSEVIQEILKLSGISKYFHHFADLPEALKFLKGNL